MRHCLLTVVVGVLLLCASARTSAQNPYKSTLDEKAMTSSFHRQNAGKILFSKTPIVVGKENPSQFTTQFTAQDKIYAVAYLRSTMKNLIGKATEASGVYMYVVDNEPNSNESGIITFTHNDSDLNQSWYSIEIIPDPDKALHGIDALEWYNAFARISPAKHSLKIVFTTEVGSGEYDEGFAAGEIQIDLSGMNMQAMRKNAESASDKARDNWARNNTSLPDWFGKASYKFKDSELSAANMQTLFQKRWAAEGRQVLKLVAFADPYSNEEWTLNKNGLGIPTEKITGSKIGVLYKAKDGWCYFVENVHFRREYAGGGQFGSVQYYTEGAATKIDCAKVK